MGKNSIISFCLCSLSERSEKVELQAAVIDVVQFFGCDGEVDRIERFVFVLNADYDVAVIFFGNFDQRFKVLTATHIESLQNHHLCSVGKLQNHIAQHLIACNRAYNVFIIELYAFKLPDVEVQRTFKVGLVNGVLNLGRRAGTECDRQQQCYKQYLFQNR